MQQGALLPDDDYHEKKDEIINNMNTLSALADDIEKMDESYKTCKANKEGFKAQFKKASSTENMKKIFDQMMANKNNITNIYSDSLDT